MWKENRILLAKGENEVHLLPQMANRHGLITGATGTGKTITLKVLAESFSDAGVPVFLADIKGDLSGMCKKGEINPKLQERLDSLELTDFNFKSYPTHFFDVFGKEGHPVRTTISEMGPILLSRLLDLTEAQQGVLNIVFRIADDNGWLLIDLKDLRAMVRYVGDHAKEFATEYGNIATASIGAIQRSLLALEDEGGEIFFGEPALDLNDWLMKDDQGNGFINILECVELVKRPLLYSTFLLWMLSELYENLPEEGDLDKPKMVFFFDEAHLLFKDAPKSLVSKVEQIVKLIRSKGVGVYFISQSCADIPDSVLSQLQNRIQHALHAYTQAEQKAVNIAAKAFRENPKFKTKDVINDLATGEALVSCLDEKGVPCIVERAMILPPQSQMGPIDEKRRQDEISISELYGKYEKEIDRESAYEVIQDVVKEEEKLAEIEQKEKEQAKAVAKAKRSKSTFERAATNAASTLTRETSKMIIDAAMGKQTRNRKSPLEKAASSAISTLSGEVGKTISRGLFGILKNR
ncbi:MAG: DUF853 family protein [Erysipelotrichaceae bacterium]|nr:DUF853 family protein [Erysipelotrichaceae bacterium]